MGRRHLRWRREGNKGATTKDIKKENSPVQWLGFHAYTAGSQVPIPCWGTEIMKAGSTRHCPLLPQKRHRERPRQPEPMQTRAEGMMWKTGGGRFQRYKGNLHSGILRLLVRREDKERNDIHVSSWVPGVGRLPSTEKDGGLDLRRRWWWCQFWN